MTHWQVRTWTSHHLARFYDWLDAHLFPKVLAYTTHRVHIVGLMLLWLGLLLGGAFTAFELVGGNYTNGLSALASCIVLMQQMKHHAENKRMHQSHAEEIAKLRADHETHSAAHGEALGALQSQVAALVIPAPSTRRRAAAPSDLPRTRAGGHSKQTNQEAEAK